MRSTSCAFCRLIAASFRRVRSRVTSPMSTMNTGMSGRVTMMMTPEIGSVHSSTTTMSGVMTTVDSRAGRYPDR